MKRHCYSMWSKKALHSKHFETGIITKPCLTNHYSKFAARNTNGCHKAGPVRLQTTQTLKGSKRKTSVELQTSACRRKKEIEKEINSVYRRRTETAQCEQAVHCQHFLTCGYTRQKSQQTAADFYHALHCDGGYTLPHRPRKHLSIMFFIPAVHQKLSRPTKANSHICSAHWTLQIFSASFRRNVNGNKIESKYLFGWNNGVTR